MFLRNYYTAFDAESSPPRVGLAIDYDSVVGTIKDDDSKSHPLAIVAILFSIVGVFLLVIGILSYLKSKRMQHEINVDEVVRRRVAIEREETLGNDESYDESYDEDEAENEYPLIGR